MNLIDFYTESYEPQRLFGKSSETKRLYRFSVRSFEKTVGIPTLGDLTDANLARHMQRLLDDGRSPSTANKDHSHLTAIWRFANRLNLVETWPTLPKLKEPKRTPKAWLPEEMAAIFRACDKQTGRFGPVPRSLWWTTLLHVMSDTGERIGAVRQLSWNWVQGEWVNFPAEVRKGSRRDRAYRLSPKTWGHLQAVRMVSPKRPFPWPYSGNYLWRLYGELLESAGLPNDRGSKFHRVRKTVGSAIHAAGMDATEALDHCDRRTTQAYLDPRFARDRQACDVMREFLENPKIRETRERDAG